MLLHILFFLVVGMGAGLMAGLFGLGGGLVVVPALSFFFAAFPSTTHVAMQLATATSLSIMVFTTLSSATSHHLHHNIVWPQLCRFLPGLLIGIILGSLSTQTLHTNLLHQLFGGFVLLVVA